MRNKGFFWFLTILLAVICVYQLSFTYFANSVENNAEKAVTSKVDKLIANAKKAGDSTIVVPNHAPVNIYNPESREIAIQAYLNDTLSRMADKEVYPVFGTSFKDVKKRSLAFGLDLVGGMSVTLEISIPDLVKSYVIDANGAKFDKAYTEAKKQYKNGGDFVEIFIAEYRRIDPKGRLAGLFEISRMDGINKDSSDDDIIAFLKSKTDGAMDGVEEIMNRRINQFGVAQPNMQRDPAKNRLYIELPGVSDEVTVAEKLQSTANLEFYEMFTVQELFTSYGNVLMLVDEIVKGGNSPSNDDSGSDNTSTSGATDEAKASDEANAGEVDLSVEGEEAKTTDGIGKYIYPINPQPDLPILLYATANNKSAIDEAFQRAFDEGKIPDSDVKFMWSADPVEIEGNNKKKVQVYTYNIIKVPAGGHAELDGKSITSADASFNAEEGKVVVNLTMDAKGTEEWARITEANRGRQVAITMDNIVYSAPSVNEAITQGRTQISGNFKISEAQEFASLLNAGSLPAPCEIKEQTKVGPTIGKENSRAGLLSFAFALALVFIYMIFYYGKAGIVANIALFANILFILGSLASFHAVLTLAGIAGIVLTIGMAVDANVLIFERIREEQTAGKDLKSAVEVGFRKALSSIIDANVTTLLTAIVLKVFGTGPIESFATTLIIGIFTSVFAALVITRLVINYMMDKGKSVNFESKMTKNAFKNFNFNFVGKRKMYYAISGVLIAGGIAAIVVKGLNPSVEFSGGTMYGVKFEKSVIGMQDEIGKELDKVFVEDGKTASTTLKTKSSSYFLEITTNFKKDEDNANAEVKAKLVEGLKKLEGKTGKFTVEESRSVSSSVSNELIQSSTIAIVLSLLIIFAYILLRFGKWQYSTGAIIAMVHDVVLVLSVFSIFHGILPFNMDVDQAFIAAILTVIGYSINDTVIVFDRIRENLGIYKGDDEMANVNRSLNSTLSRTINTSLTTFIVLLVIFIFGGVAIRGFIFALMIGVVVGTYSSVCIATPVLIDFSKRLTRKKK